MPTLDERTIELRLLLPGNPTPTKRLVACVSIVEDAIVGIAIRVAPTVSGDTATDPTSAGDWSDWWRSDGPRPAPIASHPVRLAGTPFQRRVWSALRATRPGDRLCYSELAAQIGHPRAVRAVAQACAANPCALWVPCHRIVRRDGGLGGYRWGVAVKQCLLDAERRVAHDPRRSAN